MDTFYLISIFLITGLILYYFFEHKKNHLSFDKVLFPIFITLFILSSIGIFTLKDQVFFNENLQTTLTITFEPYKKIVFFILNLLFFVFTYSFCFVFSRNRTSIYKIKFLSWIIIFLVIISFLLTFYFDKEFYHFLFIDNTFIPTKYFIYSFFPNHNTFGFLALIGVFACIFISTYKRHVILYFLLLFFNIISLLTGCLTTTFLSVSISFVFYVVEIIRAFKINIKKASIFLSFFVIFNVSLILLTIFSLKIEVPFFSRSIRFFYDYFFNKDYESFTNRKQIWGAFLSYFSNDTSHMFFGYGMISSFDISRGIIFSISKTLDVDPVFSIHNGFLQVLLDYGIFGFLFYISFNIYLIYSLIRLLIKKEFKFVFNMSILLFAYLTYSYFESSYFFKPDTIGIVATFLIPLPILQARKNILFSLRRKEFINKQINLIPFKQKELSAFLMSLLFPLPIAFILGIFVPNSSFLNANNNLFFLSLSITLFLLVLFLPYLISLWRQEKSIFNANLMTFFNSFLLIFIPALFTLLYFFVPSFNSIQYGELFFVQSILLGVVILDLIIYMIIKKGSLKSLLVLNFKGIFSNNIFAFISLIIMSLVCIVLRFYCYFDYIGNIALILLILLVYYGNLILFSKPVNYFYLSKINDRLLKRFQNIARGRKI